MKNIMRNTIFTNFIYSAEFELDLIKLKEECLLAKDFNASVYASNRGGWQGKIPDTNNNELKELNQKALTFVNFVSDNERLNLKLALASSWININYANSYNVVQSHGAADMIGVFYVSSPHPVGDLYVIRKDGAEFRNTYTNKPEEIEFSIHPCPGRMYVFPAWLLHYVAPSPYSKDERISIAFNYDAIVGEPK